MSIEGIDFTPAAIEPLTEDGGIVCLLREGQTFGQPVYSLDTIKTIKFEVETFTPTGQPCRAQNFFFLSKFRSIDPKKLDHNMPEGIVRCLAYCPKNQDRWFQVRPEYQGNASIQGYPVEEHPFTVRLKVTDVLRLKVMNPSDFSSYVSCVLAFKEEGNDFFKAEEYHKALDAYEKGLKVSANVPKKLRESTKLAADPLLAEMDRVVLDLLNNEAACCLKLKKLDQGLQATEKALKMDPENEKAKFRMAKLSEASGNLGEALQLFEELRLPSYSQAVRKQIQIQNKGIANKIKKAFESESN